jgi:hypothetical protein
MLCTHQVVYRCSQRVQNFHVIVTGKVSISIENHVVAYLTDQVRSRCHCALQHHDGALTRGHPALRQAHFGELEIVAGAGRRIATVTSIGKSSIISIPKHAYMRLFPGYELHGRYQSFLRGLPGFTEASMWDIARLYYTATLRRFKVRKRAS